jgi:hypothetical protein
MTAYDVFVEIVIMFMTVWVLHNPYDDMKLSRALRGGPCQICLCGKIMTILRSSYARISPVHTCPVYGPSPLNAAFYYHYFLGLGLFEIKYKFELWPFSISIVFDFRPSYLHVFSNVH